jgi:putative transposase
LTGTVLDVFSRKIVGAEVFEAENMANSACVLERAVLREKLLHRPLILHADNGTPMKGSTLQATLERLGVTASHSRPRVSNDNAFSEALFRTCKYRPSYPTSGFESLEDARSWVLAFLGWYNEEHRHSAIRFVTPAERHAGKDKAILARRHEIYEQKRAEHPQRWSGPTRNWDPVGKVWLNPDSDAKSLEAA